MKVSTETLENRQAVLNIEVDPEEMEESLNKAYHRLINKVNIPGFRKGKAPRSILEHYVGKEGLQEEALEELIPQVCSQAIEEQEMEIIAKPQVEVLQLSPVVLKATVSLRPQVELGEYHHISLAPEPAEVTEEQIDNYLEQLRNRYAVWNPMEHPVRFGDLAIIDIESREEGAESANSYKGQQCPVIQGSVLPLPGFTEQLVGMVKGEEKEFSLSYPDDHEIKELAGKQYNLKVQLIEVKEKRLPELNDEFVKSLGENLETVDALKEWIDTRLKNIAEEKARKDFEQKVIEAAVNLAKVEFPPILVEQEIDRFLSEREEMLKNQGGLGTYLESLNKSEEEVREEIRPDATKRVIEALVLGKIANEEKIEVGAEEVDAEIEGMLSNAGQNAEGVRKLFDTYQGRRWIEERLILHKTVQCLAEIAITDMAEESSAEINREEVEDAESA